ncbi:hypothetical protein [Lentzea guizhouensis]|uniref:hypothetical protein n=1 Tax=Lentzea guizhouensis TaxID=1586287 RepID=UPI0012B6924F|nr:hypothetical protein [Lentzea guizhouensis]
MSEHGTQQLNRSAMRALLAHYRITADDTAPEDVITDWLRELRGRSVGECHAALSSMAPGRVQRATAAEVARLITLAVQAGRDGRAELGASACHATGPPTRRRARAASARSTRRWAGAGTRSTRSPVRCRARSAGRWPESHAAP